MATLPIGTIEDALAERGLETSYHSTDELGSYTITGSSKVIEIIEGVSLDSFTSENVVEAVVYGDTLRDTADVTAAFEGVETVEEFLKAVAEIMQ
jgi:predicted ATP-grasp superfamily ATP-dependent carboligase